MADGYLNLGSVRVDGIRQIVGSANADFIIGTSHASSSSLNDLIDGRQGDDTLAGGNGNDTLTGGAGNDVFVFGTNNGNDRVTDFTSGYDLIDLSGTSAADISDISITSGDGGWAVLAVDNTTITLDGITAANLTSSNFIF
jgi:Ca2+-binding RTX toxin-like protein